MEAKEYLTIEEAAEYLSFNRTTLYKYMKELGIKGVKFKLDRRTYLSQAEVKRLQEVKEKPWLAGIDEEKSEEGLSEDEEIEPVCIAPVSMERRPNLYPC